MEFFLLIIDDVEDTLYTVVHLWTRLCRAALYVAVVPCTMLLASRFVVMAPGWIFVLAVVTAVCVALWAISAGTSLFDYLRETTKVA